MTSGEKKETLLEFVVKKCMMAQMGNIVIKSSVLKRMLMRTTGGQWKSQWSRIGRIHAPRISVLGRLSRIGGLVVRLLAVGWAR